jgi:transposase
MENRITEAIRSVCGLDLGDKYSHLCILDAASGEVIEESRLRTSPAGLRRRFGEIPRMRIALEVGTHSPWICRLLEELGHEVVLANPRRLRLIYENRKKSDRVDAQYLARLARLDPELLAPIEPRGQQVQADLAVLRARDALVRARTRLVNHLRGTVKSMGCRLPRCGTSAFPKKAVESIPEELRPAVVPLMETICSLNRKIRGYDKQLEELGRTRYPQTELLRQIRGVGVITALAFVLILEDPRRFRRSRTVGAYLGLVPARKDSGEFAPQLRITKHGNVLLRRLLVGSAQYMLGPFGEDCDLRRYGIRLADRGGKSAKKRAIVAVARKLAVLLHRLWRTAEVYEPFRNSQGNDEQAA